MAPKEVFKLYTAALDRGDLDAMAALIHDNFRLEGAGLDGIGKPEFLGAMKAQLDAFPDYSENPTDMTEDGDVVRFVAHVRGTQRGKLGSAGDGADRTDRQADQAAAGAGVGQGQRRSVAALSRGSSGGRRHSRNPEPAWSWLQRLTGRPARYSLSG